MESSLARLDQTVKTSSIVMGSLEKTNNWTYTGGRNLLFRNCGRPGVSSDMPPKGGSKKAESKKAPPPKKIKPKPLEANVLFDEAEAIREVALYLVLASTLTILAHTRVRLS